MPDITMCLEHQCNRKFECFRYCAIPNEFRQSYFMDDPRNDDGSCDDHLEIYPDSRSIKPEVAELIKSGGL